MLAKYLSTDTSKLTTSTLSIFYVRNSQAGKNITAKKNPTTIKDDNFYFSDYLNDSENKNEDQNGLPNDHQSSF